MSPNNLIPFPNFNQDDYEKNPELDKLWDRILENEDRLWDSWEEINKADKNKLSTDNKLDDDDIWFLIF